MFSMLNFLLNSGNEQRAGSLSTTKGTPTSLQMLELVAAEILYGIDGLADDESRGLDSLYGRYEPKTRAAVLAQMKEYEPIELMRNIYRTVQSHSSPGLEDFLRRCAQADGMVTAEEKAFMVQVAQITEGLEPLRLYVSTKSPNAVSPYPTIFSYFTERDFHENHEGSCGEFHNGLLYVDDPFNDSAVIPWSHDALKASQDSMFDGLIQLLKDLHAKRVEISLNRREGGSHDSRTRVNATAGGQVHGVPAEASISAESRGLGERISESHATLVVEFEGGAPRILDRIFVNRWRARLAKRYKSNAQYLAILNGRLGSNRMKTFDHAVKSQRALKLARAMEVDAKFNAAGYKGGAGYSSDDKNSSSYFGERRLYIKFH